MGYLGPDGSWKDSVFMNAMVAIQVADDVAEMKRAAARVCKCGGKLVWDRDLGECVWVATCSDCGQRQDDGAGDDGRPLLEIDEALLDRCKRETDRLDEARAKKVAAMQRPELHTLAAEALMVQAHLARSDPGLFFEFVVREETTRANLQLAPHQRVLFDFVWAHPRCVLRMPAGSSKTMCMGATTLFLLGLDPTQRGAVVSATQQQSQKVVGMVADHIEQPELNGPLRLVFPGLRKTRRTQDPWTQTKITVDRPPGIRDASLIAIGTDGNLPGSRLSWVIVDDILSRQNTLTPDSRDGVLEFFDSTVLSRLDPDGRLVVTNTPWHPDDLTYVLEKAGWPTLTMDVAGNIFLTNVEEDWDTPAIRPGKQQGEIYRLTEHDPDPDEGRPLWDLKFSTSQIEILRATHLPHRFNQLYMCQCRDEASARCKWEWIKKCLENGRAFKNSDGSQGATLVSSYNGPNPTVTGVDLAVGQDSDKHDETAFVTLELMPTGKRRLLDVESGRWTGPTIVEKLIDKNRRYNSIVRVENNAAQDYIRQFALAANASVPVKAHTTGRNRAHAEFGVESIFVELSNGAWIIPCDRRLHPPKAVAKLLDGWLYYEPPPRHTPDLVMAAWFAREQARALGDGLVNARATSIGIQNLMSR